MRLSSFLKFKPYLLSSGSVFTLLDLVAQVLRGLVFLILAWRFGVSSLGNFYYSISFFQLALVITTNSYSRETYYSKLQSVNYIFDAQMFTRIVVGCIMSLLITGFIQINGFILLYVFFESYNDKFESYLIGDKTMILKSSFVKIFTTCIWLLIVLIIDESDLLIGYYVLYSFSRFLLYFIIIWNLKNIVWLQKISSLVLIKDISKSFPILLNRALPATLDVLIISSYNAYSPKYSGIFAIINRLGNTVNISLQSLYKYVTFKGIVARNRYEDLLDKWVYRIVFVYTVICIGCVIFTHTQRIQYPLFVFTELFISVILIADSYYVLTAMVNGNQKKVFYASLPQILLITFLAIYYSENVEYLSFIKCLAALAFTIFNGFFISELSYKYKVKFSLIFVLSIFVIYVSWYYGN